MFNIVVIAPDYYDRIVERLKSLNIKYQIRKDVAFFYDPLTAITIRRKVFNVRGSQADIIYWNDSGIEEEREIIYSCVNDSMVQPLNKFLIKLRIGENHAEI